MSETEELNFQLSILRPKKGDVLVVRPGKDMTAQQIEHFMSTLQQNAKDFQGVFVLLLSGDKIQDAHIWPENKARELLRKRES